MVGASVHYWKDSAIEEPLASVDESNEDKPPSNYNIDIVYQQKQNLECAAYNAPVYVQVLHVQDASNAFCNVKDELADRFESFISDLEGYFGAEYVFSGLVSFLDDRSPFDDPDADDSIYCYREETKFQLNNGPLIGDKLRDMKVHYDYRNLEG